MSIRPLDIQLNYQKASEYTKEASAAHHKTNVFQVQQSSEMQKNVIEKKRKVLNTEKTANRKVKKDEKQKSQHRRTRYSSSQDDRRCPKDDFMDQELSVGSLFDIRI